MAGIYYKDVNGREVRLPGFVGPRGPQGPKGDGEALKGTATGSAVRMDDVSPLEHEMAVKVRSKNLFNNDTSKIEQKTYISSDGTTCSRWGYAVYLPAGTYMIHAEPKDDTAFEAERFIYSIVNKADGSYVSGVYNVPNKVANGQIVAQKKCYEIRCTINEGDVLYIYNASTQQLAHAQNLFSLFNIQIEQGITATAFTPYVDDVSAVKVQKYGKNLLDDNLDNVAAITFTDSSGAVKNFFGFALPLTAGTYTAHAEGSTSTEYIYGVLVGADGVVKQDVNTVVATELRVATFTAADGDILYIYNAGSGNSILKQSKEFIGRYKYQVEVGETKSGYAPYIEPTEYTPNADGTVTGVTSLYPTTTLVTDTEGAVIEVEYNRDINKAFDELKQAIISLGGNV